MANTESEKILQNHYEWCLKEGRSTSWRASKRASEREGGPTGCQADKLNAVNSARFVESAQAQLGRKPKKAR